MSNDLRALVTTIAADGAVSAAEALRLRQSVFPDGVVSRTEAELLIALSAKVADADEAWANAFVEAIVDHALGAGPSPGHVDESTASWLVRTLGGRRLEVEAVLKILERSESAPEMLSDFARDKVADLVAGKPIGEEETDLIRRCLYAASGPDAVAVSEAEALWIFTLDAESDGRDNHPSWSDLFVKTALNHLMGRHAPARVERSRLAARETWLHTQPMALPGISLLSMFNGGVNGFWAKLRQDNPFDAMRAYYQAANDAADAQAVLTPQEAEWTVRQADADGRRTANETALLAEIQSLQPRQPPTR